ncbi:MAG: iron chelate uptake ABC transporter family permease subunit [Flavobacteriales bacterium]
MGSLSGLQCEQLSFFFVFISLGLVAALFLLKPLNALLLGDCYAQTLGTSLVQIRVMIMLTSRVLTAASTVFTGLIVFVGMVIPHLSRMLFRSVDH